MTEEMIVQLGSEAIQTILYLAGPILLVAMVVGIVISILQAVTQINEATLTFIPKIFAVVAVLAVMSPWMIHVMHEYTVQVFEQAAIHAGEKAR
jgi:flagellar biosynthetic protein FliQ